MAMITAATITTVVMPVMMMTSIMMIPAAVAPDQEGDHIGWQIGSQIVIAGIPPRDIDRLQLLAVRLDRVDDSPSTCPALDLTVTVDEAEFLEDFFPAPAKGLRRVV